MTGVSQLVSDAADAGHREFSSSHHMGLDLKMLG